MFVANKIAVDTRNMGKGSRSSLQIDNWHECTNDVVSWNDPGGFSYWVRHFQVVQADNQAQSTRISRHIINAYKQNLGTVKQFRENLCNAGTKDEHQMQGT